MQQKYFSASNLSSPQGAAILVHSLPMKSGKRLTKDILDTSATHDKLVHDVIIQTAKLKTAAIKLLFSFFPNIDFSQTSHKLTGKTAVSVWFIPFLSIGPVVHLRFMFQVIPTPLPLPPHHLYIQDPEEGVGNPASWLLKAPHCSGWRC